MKRGDPKERALLEVRRRKSELDQIENFLGGCSESGLEFLRGLLVRKGDPPLRQL